MTTTEARTLAQKDPVPNMLSQWGEASTHAQNYLHRLVTELRALDALAETLSEHGHTVSVDLGPIGNAAAAARRDLEKQRDTTTFELPR